RTAAKPGRAAPDRGDRRRRRRRSRLSDVLSSAGGRTGHALRLHDAGSLVTFLAELVSDQLRTDLPEIASGDTVKVSAKVIEGNRERIQVFEGIVMRLRGGGITRSITVRRIASGVGVERTFKIHSPRIEKIEVL